MRWQEHIQVNPMVTFGKPVVAGTRIPVYMVLELIEALGLRMALFMIS